MVSPSFSIVSLGCSRNDVDSEELAGRLAADGWHIGADGAPVDVVLVNTCGFIEQAKKDSIDVLLEAMDQREAGHSTKVVAVGCMAQRYGAELHEALPEADAILSFDHYQGIGATLRDILAGKPVTPHQPVDRRTLLSITPVERDITNVAVPGMGPHLYRARLSDQPWAPLKIASGCDRRCTFCAIPSFRGSYVSRLPEEVLAEAQWLAGQGVKEALLVSENSTSYGKDLGDLRALEKLLAVLAQHSGLPWIRVSYLQPAEIRPDLIGVIAQTPGIVPYFDLSFQHASNAVLRRMKRFGGSENFLDLVAAIRGLNPMAGIRTNVIVGFPGETEQDVEELVRFLESARMDAVGVFAYSDEEGTAAVELDGHLSDSEVADRYSHVSSVAERMCDYAASQRIGQTVTVLIDESENFGRAAHQGPEVDGGTLVMADRELDIGQLVSATVMSTDGIDLVAQFIETID